MAHVFASIGLRVQRADDRAGRVARKRRQLRVSVDKRPFTLVLNQSDLHHMAAAQ